MVKPSNEVTQDLSLGFKVPFNMIQMQQRDPEREVGNESEHFMQGSILFHQHGPAKQLVVPKGARDTVLVLGHSVPWAGHLG